MVKIVVRAIDWPEWPFDTARECITCRSRFLLTPDDFTSMVPDSVNAVHGTCPVCGTPLVILREDNRTEWHLGVRASQD